MSVAKDHCQPQVPDPKPPDHAGLPELIRYTPEDHPATIFHLPGSGPGRDVHGAVGRPTTPSWSMPCF